MFLLKENKYKIILNKQISNNDLETINLFYAPLIGHKAISLYMHFYFNQKEVYFTHDYLVLNLGTSLSKIENAREKLEAIGLLKSYVKTGEYVYELFTPLSCFEFMNHPLLGEFLRSNVDSSTFNHLSKLCENEKINLNEYKNISKSFKEIFRFNKISTKDYSIKKDSNIVINSNLKIELIKESVNKNNFNKNAFNEEIIEMINSINHIYNLDELKIIKLLNSSVDINGFINKSDFKDKARKMYSLENGTKPNLVYKNITNESIVDQKDPMSKLIYEFENSSINEFLSSKSMGRANKRDLTVIEKVLIDNKLSIPVMNVIVDYSLRVCDNKLNSGFLEYVAGFFSRNKIKTAKDAIELAKKEHKKFKQYKNNPKGKTYVKKQEIVPKWAYEKNETKYTNELDNIFKDYTR
ncbi:MAG: hypothetical protein ACK5HL_02055 [Bacilli bacterium]